MISAKVTGQEPSIKCYINKVLPEIKVVVNNGNRVIRGVIADPHPSLIGYVKRVIDHAPEPYYEVANEYGTTIVIGD